MHPSSHSSGQLTLVLRCCAFCLAVAVAFAALGCNRGRESASPIGGTLDLSGWTPETQGPIRLAGMWEFYWNTLLTPDDFEGPTPPRPVRWLNLPVAWNAPVGGDSALPSHGVATFRVRLIGLGVSGAAAVWIPEQATAYRVWMNGELIASNGTVSWLRAQPDPVPSPKLVPITLSRTDAELVLQVANHHTLRGGPVRALELGRYEDLNTRWQRLKYLDAILFGSLTLMALYQIGHYLLRPKKKAPLFAALASLAFAMRVPVFGLSGRPITELLTAVPWEVPERLQPALSLVGIGFLCLYALSLLPPSRPCTIVKWLGLMDIFGGAVVMVVPKAISSWAFHAVFVCDLTLFSLLLFEVAKAVRNKSPDGLQLLASWLVMAPVGFAEIAVNVGSGTGTHIPLMPIGIFLFMLLHTWRAASQIHAAYNAVESLSTDIRKRNVQLLRMEALKEEFLTGTSHELRMPLHAIVGLGESLLEGVAGALPLRIREGLTHIVTSGRRLTSLIGDIQEFSRLRQGDVQLQLRPVDIRTLASTVLSVLAPAAEEKKLVLCNEIPLGLPLLAADENRLFQAMLHAFHEAIKATGSGCVLVRAQVSKDLLEVAVSWRGAKGAEHEPATESNPPGHNPAGGPNPSFGVGYGPNIARYLVHLHGGTIEANRKRTGECLFTIQLPLSPSLEQAPCEAVVPMKLDPPLFDEGDVPAGSILPRTADRLYSENQPLKGAKILVVDDDPVSVRLIEEQLRLAGACVRATVRGEDALPTSRNESFDLVLLDVMMPRVTGFEICRDLRSCFSWLELPILLLTARADPSDLTLGFDVGANDYLVKPFTRVELLTRCRTHVELKRLFAAEAQKAALQREIELQRHQVEWADLRAARAELEKLRYQVNPHLLFNTLTNIRGAISRTPQAAREMVSLLAEYYRMTLVVGRRNVVPLNEEIQLTECYLNIELARHQYTRPVSWEIEPCARQFSVPALLLQPIVENAMKFGRTDGENETEFLRISARLSESALLLRVSNAGDWIPHEHYALGDQSVGLDNVRRRLSLYYGCEAAVRSWTRDGWVHVDLYLPCPATDSDFRPMNGMSGLGYTQHPDVAQCDSILREQPALVEQVDGSHLRGHSNVAPQARRSEKNET